MDLRNILEEFLMDSNCAFYKKVVVVGEGHCVAIFSCLILTLFIEIVVAFITFINSIQFNSILFVSNTILSQS